LQRSLETTNRKLTIVRKKIEELRGRGAFRTGRGSVRSLTRQKSQTTGLADIVDSIVTGISGAKGGGGLSSKPRPNSLECALSRQLLQISLLQLLDRRFEALRIDEAIGIEGVARLVLLMQLELRRVRGEPDVDLH